MNLLSRCIHIHGQGHLPVGAPPQVVTITHHLLALPPLLPAHLQTPKPPTHHKPCKKGSYTAQVLPLHPSSTVKYNQNGWLPEMTALPPLVLKQSQGIGVTGGGFGSEGKDVQCLSGSTGEGDEHHAQYDGGYVHLHSQDYSVDANWVGGDLQPTDVCTMVEPISEDTRGDNTSSCNPHPSITTLTEVGSHLQSQPPGGTTLGGPFDGPIAQ
ncbi:hypothetical protein EDC04DRAFT_2601220 [Pisolithus marmoratus]|nr:hypothetical protein EDC04DRAFT_2601220 [Pisolithus marmoratus]